MKWKQCRGAETVKFCSNSNYQIFSAAPLPGATTSSPTQEIGKCLVWPHPPPPEASRGPRYCNRAFSLIINDLILNFPFQISINTGKSVEVIIECPLFMMFFDKPKLYFIEIARSIRFWEWDSCVLLVDGAENLQYGSVQNFELLQALSPRPCNYGLFLYFRRRKR
jgi:hypothetical protein